MWSNKQCDACIARDYHINSLKEQISTQSSEIQKLSAHIFELEREHVELLQHFTGMRRQPNNTNTNQEFKSMTRNNNNSIQQRIMKAEQASKDPVISAQRTKEYDDRIKSLLNPEIVVTDES